MSPIKVKIMAIIQARMGSSRFPGKVLQKINGKTVIRIISERLRTSKELDSIILAIPSGKDNDVLAREGEQCNLPVVRGSEYDIVSRLLAATRVEKNVSAIVRITADCPLIDPEIIDKLVRVYKRDPLKFDYLTNDFPFTFPMGLNIDILPVSTLKKLDSTLKNEYDREWLTLYLRKNIKIFRIYNLVSSEDFSYIRITLDHPADLRLIRKIYNELSKNDNFFLMKDIIRFLRKFPALLDINRKYINYEELAEGKDNFYIKTGLKQI